MLNHSFSRFLCLTAFIFVVLTGCSSTPDYNAMSEQQLFEESQSALERENYTIAIEVLTQLEARFPFGRYTTQAKLDLLYAYYQAQEYESAGAAAKRFVRMYSDHEDVDYAWYIKALSGFTVDRGLLDRIMPSDYSERDMGLARESFRDFNTIVTRYPDSPYANDSRQRMIYLRNLLAKQQLENAHFYLRRGAYVAAIRRATRVIQAFPETPDQPRALEIMARGYKALDLNDLEATTLAVLKHNYPDYEVLNKSGTLKPDPTLPLEERSLTNIVTFGLMD